jgi:hypothetical protein
MYSARTTRGQKTGTRSDEQIALGFRLALAITLLAVVSLVLRQDGQFPGVSLPVEHTGETSRLAQESGVGLEARWIGRAVAVKHHPESSCCRVFARLDGDAMWTNRGVHRSSPGPWPGYSAP